MPRMALRLLIAGAVTGLAIAIWWSGFRRGRELAHPELNLWPVQFSSRTADLAPGRFLVARRDLPDPNFDEAVVLLVHYDQEGAMGLVINRRTRIPMSRVFEELEKARGRGEPVFLGGPVQRTGVLALLRAKAKPEEAQTVFGEVHLVTTRTLLEKSLTAGTGSSEFRVYLGHSGWGPGQLEREVEIGTWHIFKGDMNSVFHPDPDTVWGRFIERTELQIARATWAPAPVL
ncbi:MAG: YqgE/AlgH family protein [Bryobacteraceae bacterium]